MKTRDVLPDYFIESLESMHKDIRNITNNIDLARKSVDSLVNIKDKCDIIDISNLSNYLLKFDSLSENLHENEKTLEELLRKFKSEEKAPVYIEKNKVKMNFSKMEKNVAYPIEHSGKMFFIQKPQEGRIMIYEVV